MRLSVNEVNNVPGLAGAVRQIGLFTCQLEAFDGLFLFVPNSALWNVPLRNYSRNAGRLMPHQALLDRVWGSEYGATTDYLKVYVSRLRAKLEPDANAPRYIQTERGLGYRFVRPPEAAPPAPQS